jgi:hypothetical protein
MIGAAGNRLFIDFFIKSRCRCGKIGLANNDTTIKIGSYSEDGLVYVMQENVPVVYTAECSFYEKIKNIKNKKALFFIYASFLLYHQANYTSDGIE